MLTLLYFQIQLKFKSLKKCKVFLIKQNLVKFKKNWIDIFKFNSNMTYNMIGIPG
jgi:hypothetical protein